MYKNHIIKRNRKPVISLFSFGLYILSFIFFAVIFTIITNNSNFILGYATNIEVYDLVKDTNTYREDLGLLPLKLSRKLSDAAFEKAQHMFENNYWAHTAPDGTQPWAFIEKEGYHYIMAGENLAVDFQNSSDVVKAWISSKTHNDNLINKRYKDVGFAVVNGELNGRDTTLVVQMFGLPTDNDPNDQIIMADLAEAGIEKEPVNLKTVDVDKEVSSVKSPEVSQGVVNEIGQYDIARYFAMAFGIFLIVMFVLDAYVLTERDLTRHTGHSVLHIIFIFIAIIAIWHTTAGLIL